MGFVVLLGLTLLVERSVEAKPRPKGSAVRIVIPQDHVGFLTSIQYSRDGRVVVTAANGAGIVVRDAASMRQLRTFQYHANTPGCMALTRDGRYLLHGGTSQAGWGGANAQDVRIHDVVTGTEVARVAVPSDVNAMAFSPDDQRVLLGHVDGSLSLFAREHLTHPRKWLRTNAHSGPVMTVLFSPDGASIYSSGPRSAKRFTRKGRVLRKFSGHRDVVRDIALSPDGTLLVTGSDDGTALLWDTKRAGKPTQTWHPGFGVDDVDFSSDGRHVLMASQKGAASLWRTDSPERVREFQAGGRGQRGTVCFAPRGATFLIGSSGNVLEGTLDASDVTLRTRSWTAKIDAFALSHDGRWLVVASDGHALIFDVRTGRMIRQVPWSGGPDVFEALSLCPVRSEVLLHQPDEAARIEHILTGQIRLRLPFFKERISASVISPDGAIVATAQRGVVRVFDAKTGALRNTLSAGHDVQRLVVSPDGTHLAAVLRGRSTRVWSLENNRELPQFQHPASSTAFAFAPDGRTVLCHNDALGTTTFDNVVVRYQLKRRHAPPMSYPSVKYPDEGHRESVSCLIVAPDGSLVTGAQDGTIHRWNLKTGRLLMRYAGHRQAVQKIAASGDGRIIASSEAEALHLWDGRTGAALCTLAVSSRVKRAQNGVPTDPMDVTQWIVRAGSRFDAANRGHIQGAHAAAGLIALDLDQVRSTSYEPGLLARAVAQQPLARDPPVVLPPPRIEAESPSTGDPVLRVKVVNQGGGIGPVRVDLNGKRIRRDARGHTVTSNEAALDVEVDLAADPRVLPGRPNVVRVTAGNAADTANSKGWRRTYVAPGEPRTPHLHALVCGVSDYEGQAIDLKYAAEDAAAIAHALRLGGEVLFGKERVHVTVLTSPATNGTLAATRKNFMLAMQELRKAKSDDVLVLYVSGHGATSDHGYHYFLSDAKTLDVSDAKERARVALSGNEFTKLIEAIPTVRRQLFVLDTCAAGQVRDDFRHFVGHEQFVDEVHDHTDIFVLAGCASDTSSFEFNPFGQGLLTYALLQGLQCGCQQTGSRVNVGKLLAYAAAKVPELAQHAGQTQLPVMLPGDEPFDIGDLDEDRRKRISLKMPKPCLVRALFVLERKPSDPLGLARAVNDTIPSFRPDGPDTLPAMFFVDGAARTPGNYQVSGTYRVKGGVASGTAYVVRFAKDRDEEVGSFPFQGAVKTTADREALADSIVAKAYQELQK